MEWSPAAHGPPSRARNPDYTVPVPSLPSRLVTSVAIPVTAGLLAAIIVVGSDDAWSTAAALLLEPSLAGLGCMALLHLVAERRPARAVALALALLIFLVLLHAPWPGRTLPPPDVPWAAQVSRCSGQLQPPTGVLRVLTWRAEPPSRGSASSEETWKQVEALAPDVIVLAGRGEDEHLLAWAEARGGEARAIPFRASSIGIWVRGAFQLCGNRTDQWVLEPEASEAETPLAALVFPAVEGVGAFPLVAIHSPPSPFSPEPTWPGTPRALARVVAGLARLASPSLVVAGHLGAPPTWRDTQSTLAGTPLLDLPLHPSWPNRVLGIPWLPYLRLDRVLAGPAWTGGTTRTFRTRGEWNPVLVELHPARETAAVSPARPPRSGG